MGVCAGVLLEGWASLGSLSAGTSIESHGSDSDRYNPICNIRARRRSLVVYTSRIPDGVLSAEGSDAHLRKVTMNMRNTARQWRQRACHREFDLALALEKA